MKILRQGYFSKEKRFNTFFINLIYNKGDVFVNGAKVEFTKNGEWKDVECKYGEVPAAIVPQQIRDYVAKNFAGRKIVSIDRDKRDWEVKLDNGLDLKFDLQFRLIEIDD